MACQGPEPAGKMGVDDWPFTRPPFMNRRWPILVLAGAALLLGLGLGPVLLVPLLKLSFPGWCRQLAVEPAAAAEAAAWPFRLALAGAAMMIPVSALVTERFAREANYSHALAKSAVVWALAVGGGVFYQHQHLAAQAHLMARLPQLFGGPPIRRLAENPLTNVLWVGAVCLVLFGPLDLWIAGWQKRRRSAALPSAAGESSA